MLAVGVIVLVGAAAGTWLGREAGRGQRPEVAPPARSLLSGRGLSVVLPGGWARVAPTALPGMPAGVAVAARDSSFDTQVRMAMLPFTSPTLMPAGLVNSADGIPRPRTVNLAGGFGAYEYRGLSHPAVRGALDVLVAPTTEGVATVMCVSSEKASTLPDCAMVGRSLVVERGGPLRLGPTTAFSARLPREMAALTGVRDGERAAVGRGDPRATTRLGAAYRRAATVLGPLVPPGARRPEQIVRALDDQAGAYARLAVALRRARRAAALHARRQIIANESALRVRLGGPGSP